MLLTLTKAYKAEKTLKQAKNINNKLLLEHPTEISTKPQDTNILKNNMLCIAAIIKNENTRVECLSVTYLGQYVLCSIWRGM